MALVGMALSALLGLFVLLTALVVWQKVFVLFQAADTRMEDYLPVALGGLVFLLASGLIYQMGTGVLGAIVKAVAGG